MKSFKYVCDKTPTDENDTVNCGVLDAPSPMLATVLSAAARTLSSDDPINAHMYKYSAPF